MAINKITEKDVAESVKAAAHVLITQPEGSAGSEVETLERATLAQLAAALIHFTDDGEGNITFGT